MWLPPSFKPLKGCVHLCFQTTVTEAYFVKSLHSWSVVSPLTFGARVKVCAQLLIHSPVCLRDVILMQAEKFYIFSIKR